MSVNAGDFADAARGEVPNVKVAPAGGEEDAGAGRWQEGGGGEGVGADVKGGKGRVGRGGVVGDVVQGEGGGGARGEEKGVNGVEGERCDC